MTDMPETIWAERTPISGDEWWTDTPTPFGMEALTKYRRANLPPKVKPLVWEDRGITPPQFKAETDIGVYYIEKDKGGLFNWWSPSLRGKIQAQSLEAAKAAAQSDYTARIISALEPQ